MGADIVRSVIDVSSSLKTARFFVILGGSRVHGKTLQVPSVIGVP